MPLPAWLQPKTVAHCAITPPPKAMTFYDDFPRKRYRRSVDAPPATKGAYTKTFSFMMIAIKLAPNYFTT